MKLKHILPKELKDTELEIKKKYCCCKCQAPATWQYVPYSPNRIEKDNYYCDLCVPRGCSCNIEPISGGEYVDDFGRLLPCCEYNYCEDGFNIVE